MVPPQAHLAFRRLESSFRSMLLSSIPSMIVAILPQRLLSVVIRTRWDSLTISSHTQRSSGRPHLSQTDNLTLLLLLLLLLPDSQDASDGPAEFPDPSGALRRTASCGDR